jgi:transposase
MRQITEVLRLNAQELSYRQIALSVGISASTVQSYFERAERAGLSWPLPDDVDDAALEARLFTRTEEEIRPGRPEPNWLEVHRERKRGKHVTLQLLHLEYKTEHPEGLSYTQFCVHYWRWRARQDVVMRLEYAAGDVAALDPNGACAPAMGRMEHRPGLAPRTTWIRVDAARHDLEVRRVAGFFVPHLRARHVASSRNGSRSTRRSACRRNGQDRQHRASHTDHTRGGLQVCAPI